MARTKLEQTQKAVSASTKINTKKNVSIDTTSKKETYKCWCCGNEYTKLQSNFTPTNFPIFKHYGYYPVCRKCTDKFYPEMISFFDDSEEKAIEFICMMYGLYFNESPLAASRKISEHRSRIHTYSSKVQIKPWIGLSWLDTLKERFAKENDLIETYDDVKEDKKTKLKTVKFFGTGFSDDDYQYLQDQYTDWTTRCECKTKAQEEVFKRICFKQLEILKANRLGLNTKDLDKTFQDYLDTANLKPKQNNLDALSDAQTFGTLLAKWENERPLPEIDAELKDVDKIGLYIDVFFRGHLAKMMGLKNGLSNLYNKFIKKYTVERPEYEGDEDNEALFDAIFGSQTDDE